MRKYGICLLLGLCLLLTACGAGQETPDGDAVPAAYWTGGDADLPRLRAETIHCSEAGFYLEDGGADRSPLVTETFSGTLPDGEREAFLTWLFDLEYRRLGLPEPDLVLYLDLPTDLSEAMMRRRERETGTQADIHERDDAYLRACRENAGRIVSALGWTRIDCSREGAVRPVEEIHEELWRRVWALLAR